MSRFAGGGWSKALTNYAKTRDPSTLPKEVLLTYDDHTVIIYDAFKKAQYHCLVLPRIPFPLSQAERSTPLLSAAGGKLTLGSSSNQILASHLVNLRSLLSSPHASTVLSTLETASISAIRLLESQMQEKHGRIWPIRRGFHAIPSMEHVHLHIISQDLVSDRLKSKKHYLSFHPTNGFFLDLKEVQEYVNKGLKSLPHSDMHYEALLKGPLISFRKNQTYANIRKLSQHLLESWKDSGSPAKLKAQDEGQSSAPAKRKAQQDLGSETETEPER